MMVFAELFVWLFYIGVCTWVLRYALFGFVLCVWLLCLRFWVGLCAFGGDLVGWGGFQLLWVGLCWVFGGYWFSELWGGWVMECVCGVVWLNCLLFLYDYGCSVA